MAAGEQREIFDIECVSDDQVCPVIQTGRGPLTANWMPLQGNPPNMSTLSGHISSPASPQNSPRPTPRLHRRQNWSSNSSSSTNLPVEQLDSNSLEAETSEPSVASSDSVTREPPLAEPTVYKEKKDKKKKSWFNNFYPTYKSRCDDFKRIFKDVRSDERLIVDYSCALQREMIVHGRLYVTQNFLCFYGNIFRWEQVVTIRWKDVTALTKEKTALVIPNAILVSTENERVFLTSFVARDKAYLMLFRVWQNALMGQQMPLQEVWQWVHSSYGQELGLTSDDEDYVEQEDDKETMVVNKSAMPGGSPTPSQQLELEESRPSSTVEAAPIVDAAITPQIANNEPVAIPVASSTPSENQQDAHLETDMSDTTESEPDKTIGDPSKPIGECTSLHEGREMLRMVLPMSVDHLFTLLFTDNKFFSDFHHQRNTMNLRQTPWEKNSSNKEKQRTLNFDIPINQSLVGRKTSQVTESQAMRSKPGKMYAVDAEVSQIGFPYADSFYTSSHYCLKKVSDSETSIVVYVDIKFKKPVWVMRSYIEKHTWAGMEDHYVSLSKALTAECCAMVEGLSGRPLAKEVVKTRRRLRPSTRRLSTTQRLTEETIVPHIVRPPVVGRRSLSRGSVGSPDRRFEPVVISSPRVQRPSNSLKGVRTDTLNYMVLAVLIVLMLLNGILYYKLWALEQWSVADPFGAGIHTDLAALKQNPPKTHEEWMHLLRKQESLHTMEVHKWHKVLRSAVILLKKTEDSLKELQVSIQPRINRQFAPSQHSEL